MSDKIIINPVADNAKSENDRYFDMFLSGTFPVKEGQPNNVQGFHHYVRNRQMRVGLKCTLIRSQIITVMSLTRKADLDTADKINAALDVISEAIDAIQGMSDA